MSTDGKNSCASNLITENKQLAIMDKRKHIQQGDVLIALMNRNNKLRLNLLHIIEQTRLHD
jgi:histone H3/H4